MKSSEAVFVQPCEFTPLQPGTCRYFAKGVCRYGDTCRYAHPQPARSEPEEEIEKLKINHEPVVDSRQRRACRFFALGSCRNGLVCSFSHLANPESPQYTADDFDEPEDGDTGARELGGAMVQFGEGATVHRVELRAEFSSFRITYLPADTTVESIESLLAKSGVVIHLNHTRVAMNSDEAPIFSTAEINIAEPLSVHEIRTKVLSTLRGKYVEITGIPRCFVRGSNTHTIDCRRVQCSWDRPVCTAWLNFGNAEVAMKISQGFQSGRYKIGGREVTASRPTGEASVYNHQAFTVILSNLPSRITREEILHSFGRTTVPRHIEISKPTYNGDVDMATAKVQSLLAGIGELDGALVVGRSSSKRIEIQTKFLHEANARASVSKLHNSKLPFYPKGRLTVQLVVSAKFKMLNRIYQAVEHRIIAQKAIWINARVYLRVYPPSAAFTHIKLEGNDTKQVASAKKDLDMILAGHIIKHNDQVVWSEAWGKMKSLCHILKPVEEAFGVFIWRDSIRRHFRVYGPIRNCERAAHHFVELVHIGEDLPFEIPLSLDAFRWACQGGQNQLSLALGAKSVTLDIVSTPKRMLIHGRWEDYEKALSLIRAAKKQLTKAVPQAGNDCSACWTEAESPLRTQCGHIYCTGCFESLCSLKSTTDSDMAIRCVGGEDTCKRIFSLSELQEHLSSTTLEDILRVSFSSYIAQNPTRFRYCPTPDCGTIYRVARDGAEKTQTHTCEKCLISLCTYCHVSHESQSCGEYRSQLQAQKWTC